MEGEKRRHQRLAFAGDAKLVMGDRESTVGVLDLSLKGALIRAAAPTPIVVGGDCLLQLLLDDSGDQICMQCTIAHSEGDRLGLGVVAIDVDSITHLRRLIELNLADDDLLQRELSALVAQ